MLRMLCLCMCLSPPALSLTVPPSASGNKIIDSTLLTVLVSAAEEICNRLAPRYKHLNHPENSYSRVLRSLLSPTC